MNAKDIYNVVTKLIGDIRPIGETNIDNDRFENLKIMTGLVDKLLSDIDEITYHYKNNHQYSMKRAADFASKFYDHLGIPED
jgi:hypothetical protein